MRYIVTTRPDAFTSGKPRPRAPELIVTSFDVPSTTATDLRLEVLTNQCTGAPDYAGEQDNDPRANTDCATASPQALNVRAAEFQAFTRCQLSDEGGPVRARPRPFRYGSAGSGRVLLR